MRECHYCPWCGDMIMDGEVCYRFGDKIIHQECFKDFVFEEYETEELAVILGFERNVAGNDF